MKTPIFWIPGPWPGKLAILPRPRGGDWLEDEIVHWQRSGIEEIVSALVPEETREMNLEEEADHFLNHGIDFYSFPIPDRGIPDSIPSAEREFRKWEKDLAAGKSVAIHCRQGIGLSSLIASSLLVLGGHSSEEAWKRVEHSRGCSVPDTPEQKDWVRKLALRTRPAARK